MPSSSNEQETRDVVSCGGGRRNAANVSFPVVALRIQVGKSRQEDGRILGRRVTAESPLLMRLYALVEC